MRSDRVAPGSSGANWGDPFVRLDDVWQRIEARVCAAVLIAEMGSLTLWVLLKGASLGTHPGQSWASNLLNWLQNASSLMLIGGLRGLATRLTLWLALLGASLATSRGRHIHVDVIVRYLPPKLRAPTAILGWIAAAVVCMVAACGFVDYIAIASFRATASRACPEDSSKRCDTSVAERLATVGHVASSDFFVLGRQASLDRRSLRHVLGGEPYDRWMTAADWNAWLAGADWSAHFDKAAVDALYMDPAMPGATRMPQVSSPGTGDEARGLLIRELNFVFPLGLAIIAIKFLLRVLLVAGKRLRLDPETELDDEALVHARQRDEAAHAQALEVGSPKRGLTS